MTTSNSSKGDFRAPGTAKMAPRAVADVGNGIILAVADIGGMPDDVFHALTTDEIVKWWKYPGIYFQKDWKADLKICGAWSVTVELNDGGQVHAWGEFCEISFPHKLVMTRRFSAHPFLGERETTISYRFLPNEHGTRVTVRDEGFIGRPQAAYGNAEIWEHVLGWLDAYLCGR